MKLFQSVKHAVGRLAYSLMSHAPANWNQKFSILMDVLATDPRRMRKLPPMALDFLSMPDLDSAFPGLDADSLSTLRRFVASQYFIGDAPHL